MESAFLGIVLDASILIAAGRRKLTALQAITDIQARFGSVAIVLSAVTVAEIGHGIYRANTEEEAAKGTNLPIADLMIGACAIELGYAICTRNVRDFNRIPGLQLVTP